RRVALVDALARPALTAGGRGLRVLLALLEPGLREAVVEDAAREAGGAVDVGDDRQRRDRREVRRPRTADVELADAGERDADHAGLAVQDPRLRGDGLDDVVAVGRRGKVEEPDHAARATGAAHVDPHRRKAERARDERRRLRAVRVGRRVAGVFDERRERAIGQTLPERRPYHRRQQRAVARRDVLEALVERRLLVEGRVRVVGELQHLDRRPTTPPAAVWAVGHDV